MALIEELYAAAEQAGLLREAVWSPTGGGAVVTAKVGFRAPDENILDGLGLSTDYAITYPASNLVGLAAGDTLTLDGFAYRVREIRAIADGSEKRATLTRL